MGVTHFPRTRNFIAGLPTEHTTCRLLPDDEHPRPRQHLIRAFSDKAVSDQEPLVQGHIDLLLKKLMSLLHDDGAVTVDIGQYFSYSVFDILGEFGFGESFNCIKSQEYRGLIGLLFMLPKAGVMAASLNSYKFLTPFIYFLLPRGIMEKSKLLWDVCIKMVHQRMEMVPDHKDVMTHMLPDADGKGLDVPEIEANGFLLMFAGAETFASLLSAAVSYLVRNPEKVWKLRRELKETFKSPSDITFRSAARLS